MSCYTHKMVIVLWPQILWRHFTLCIQNKYTMHFERIINKKLNYWRGTARRSMYREHFITFISALKPYIDIVTVILCEEITVPGWIRPTVNNCGRRFHWIHHYSAIIMNYFSVVFCSLECFSFSMTTVMVNVDGSDQKQPNVLWWHCCPVRPSLHGNYYSVQYS